MVERSIHFFFICVWLYSVVLREVESEVSFGFVLNEMCQWSTRMRKRGSIHKIMLGKFCSIKVCSRDGQMVGKIRDVLDKRLKINFEMRF